VVVEVNTGGSGPPTYVLETEDGQKVNGGVEVQQQLLSTEP
jgi:hypothetical protein